ncbi:hypothetical protein BN2537_16771 [Streptomyces venezuelae]|nr:hypothetical protein BN2537_16771 [Streptomyces venezuelae]
MCMTLTRNTGATVSLTPLASAAVTTFTREVRERLRARDLAPGARLRLECVRLMGRALTVRVLSDLFECNAVTVRGAVRRFAAGGFAALVDAPRPGRPARSRHLPPRSPELNDIDRAGMALGKYEDYPGRVHTTAEAVAIDQALNRQGARIKGSAPDFAKAARSVGSKDVGKTHSGAAKHLCQRALLTLGQGGNEDHCVSVGLVTGLSYLADFSVAQQSPRGVGQTHLLDPAVRNASSLHDLHDYPSAAGGQICGCRRHERFDLDGSPRRARVSGLRPATRMSSSSPMPPPATVSCTTLTNWERLLGGVWSVSRRRVATRSTPVVALWGRTGSTPHRAGGERHDDRLRSRSGPVPLRITMVRLFRRPGPLHRRGVGAADRLLPRLSHLEFPLPPHREGPA